MSDDAIKQAVEYLTKVPTGFVMDALAKMDYMYQGTMGLLPLRGFEDAKVGGPAVTVKFSPVRNTVGPRMSLFSVLNGIAPGSIICVQGGGETSVHGDNQADMCKRAGVVAIVSAGGVRDLAGVRAVGMPIWSPGPSIRSMRTRWEMVAFNQPIEMGGVQVENGDYVFADECGAVVVPKAMLLRTAQVAREVELIEDDLEDMRANGNPTPDEVQAVYAKKSAKVPRTL
jgi:regulator of RNase E activity RraA